MRIRGVILGLATLLWGFLQAPFDHIHPGEDLDHEPVSAPMHLHVPETFSGHGPSVAAYTAPDDDEVDVLWNAAPSSPSSNPGLFHGDAELGEPVSTPARSARSAEVLGPQRRGHDPPEFSPKIPRAPPA